MPEPGGPVKLARALVNYPSFIVGHVTMNGNVENHL
jgi:hypothetical protein